MVYLYTGVFVTIWAVAWNKVLLLLLLLYYYYLYIIIIIITSMPTIIRYFILYIDGSPEERILCKIKYTFLFHECEIVSSSYSTSEMPTLSDQK